MDISLSYTLNPRMKPGRFPNLKMDDSFVSMNGNTISQNWNYFHEHGKYNVLSNPKIRLMWHASLKLSTLRFEVMPLD